MKLRPFLLALLAALAFLLPAAASAEERILFYGSDIEIRPDATMQVTETIRVRAEGNEIRRGIYRDFPTRYPTPYGREVKVGFTVLEVLRNRQPEPWVQEPLRNGVRVRIGNPDVFLPNGDHEYLIRYTTNRQLGFYNEFDELYWNVTGNGWDFPIDVADARIRLPQPVKFGQRYFYTGPEGARAKDAMVVAENPGDIRFRTTAPLSPREGLTVAVAWPKGVVTPPSADALAGWWLSDNGPPIVGFLGLFATLGYYFHAWRRAGRDPRPGTIVPIFSPADNLTPAAMRYISEMGADNRAFAAALVDLGVRGKVRLVEGEKRFFKRADTTIEKRGDPHDLPQAESDMMRELFASGDTILMDDKNHARFSAASSALAKEYKKQYEGTMFVRNWMWSIRGIAVTILALIATVAVLALAAPFHSATGQYAALGALATGAAAAMLFVWPAQGAARWIARAVGILAGLLAVGIGFALFGMTVESGRAVPLLIPALALPVAISAFWWMAAPTKAGRAVLDRIAGFRQYLSIAEEERLQTMHPPEKTPQLFEKYLPYAIALEVENEWADRFAGVLAAAAVAGQSQTFGWYSGHSDPWNHTGSFVDRVGSSLSSSVASASTAPGSSSGSGGGGSSGGGGGGGGGGGW